MEIRPINQNDDLTAISDIYEQSWKFAYQGIIPQTYLDSIPHGRWANGITRDGLISLVMTEHDSIIGTASICRSRWAQYADHGEIVSIYFLPEYIGLGYGGQLLRHCIAELSARGFDRILLWVLEENARARQFYEKNGFVCTGETMQTDLGGKDLREIMYIYDINSREQKGETDVRDQGTHPQSA